MSGLEVIKAKHNWLELVHLAMEVGEAEKKPARWDDAPITDDELRARAFVSEFVAAYLKSRGDVICHSAFQTKADAYYKLAEERDIRL